MNFYSEWNQSGASATIPEATIASGQASSVAHANNIVGSYQVSISFNGMVRAISVLLTNTKAGTSTGLVSSANPSTYGQPVTFAATVSVTPPGVGNPGGTISFYDVLDGNVPPARPEPAGTPLASIELGSQPDSPSTIFLMTTAELPAGVHHILAYYNGAGLFEVSASNIVTQTVNKAVAVVSLGNLLQVYDGAPKPVSVGTTPGGLAVSVTYDGAATPPVKPGSYAVTAVVNEANYEGSASGTLLIQARVYLPLAIRN